MTPRRAMLVVLTLLLGAWPSLAGAQDATPGLPSGRPLDLAAGFFDDSTEWWVAADQFSDHVLGGAAVPPGLARVYQSFYFSPDEAIGIHSYLYEFASPEAATPTTPTTPTAPTQPATGPGGMDYAYDRVVFTEYGEGAGGYLLFEPADPRGGGTPAAPAPLPIVLFLGACCETDDLNDATDDGAPWRAWIDHLTRRGAVVVFPRFAPPLFMIR